jgi:hypothetical protein
VSPASSAAARQEAGPPLACPGPSPVAGPGGLGDPLGPASVVMAVMTTLYISSAVNPLAHLRGLPVAVVNQDRGAAAGSQDLQIGQQVQAGLLASPAVSGRLHLVRGP